MGTPLYEKYLAEQEPQKPGGSLYEKYLAEQKPKSPVGDSFAAQSTSVAPGQAARRTEQANRPLLASANLPFGIEKDINAAAQGATFGFSDEIAGGLRSLGGEKYSDAVAKERAGLAKFREEHPVRNFVDELAGGVASTAAAGPALSGATKLSRIARSAGAGAAAGAASGAGTAEGGLAERAKGAVRGGVVGGVTGGVVGTAGEGVRATVGRGALTPEASADAMIVNRLAKDKQTIPQAVQFAKGVSDDKPFTVLDVGGKNVNRLARAVRTQPSRGSAELDAALTGRAAGTEDRTINDVIQTTGLGARQNAFKKAEDLIAQQKAAAGPAYEKAYGHGEVQDPETITQINSLIRLPVFAKAWKRGQALVELEHGPQSIAPAGISPQRWAELQAQGLDKFIPGAKTASANPTVQQIDAWKKGLDAVIESGAGSSNALSRSEARLYRQKLNGVLDRVDAEVPDYKAARAGFASDARAREAFDAGRDLFKTHPDEASLSIADMSPSEQELFRHGGLAALGDRIEGRAPNRNPASLAEKTLDQKRLRLMFPDDASFQTFQKKLGEEAQMHSTRVGLQGGSQTADKLAELADMAGVSVEAIAHAVTGHPMSAVRSLARTTVARQLQARLAGVNEAKADALATRMTAGTGAGGQADLVSMLEQAGKSVASGNQRQAALRALASQRTQRVALGAGDVEGLSLPSTTQPPAPPTLSPEQLRRFGLASRSP